MIRDVLRALLVDPTLGGIVYNVMTDEGVEAEDIFHEGWIIRELRMVMPYQYLKGAP